MSSNTTLFLACQTIQNKQRGASIHILLGFLSTLTLCHARRVWRTVRGKTQLKPTMARKSTHSILAFGQWMTKWSIVSFFSSQRKYLFARITPLCLSLSRVSTLPQVLPMQKKPILGGTIGFHMGREGKAIVGWGGEGGGNEPALYT